jgi:hypothetical protein
VTIREGSELIAIAPLMEVRESFFGLPTRKLEFISMMQYPDSPSSCSGALDFIIARKNTEVMDAIMRHLKAHGNRFDYVRLNPVPEDSPNLPALQDAVTRHGVRMRKHVAFVSAYADMGFSWVEFVKKSSKSFWKQLASQEKRLQKSGEVVYRELKTVDEIKDVLHEVLDIERRSWKWDLGVPLNSVALGNFYQEFAVEASKSDWIRIWTMEVGGKKIAYDYAAEYQGHLVVLKGSYDKEYRSYSPGNLLAFYELERYYKERCRSICYLWGGMEYKRAFAPLLKDHHEVFLFLPSWYSGVLQFLFFGMRMYWHRRTVLDIAKRVARKVGLRVRSSELTRQDQIS